MDANIKGAVVALFIVIAGTEVKKRAPCGALVHKVEDSKAAV